MAQRLTDDASLPPLPLPPPAVPTSGDSNPFPISYVIAITVGGCVGLILLLVACCCGFRCYRRWKKKRVFRQYDLKHQLGDPKAQHGAVAMVALPGDGGCKPGNKAALLKGMSQLATIKESELAVSPNVVVDLGDHDQLELNGLTVQHFSEPPTIPGASGRSPLLLAPGSANGGLEKLPSSSAGGRMSSILRWLESTELPTHGLQPASLPIPSGQGPQGSLLPPMLSLPTATGRLATSMRNMLGVQESAEVAEMRRRLLLAAGHAYTGDSASAPLDLKGITFARLPPSRMASPAPSSINGDSMSVAGSAISRTRPHIKRLPEVTTHDGLPTAELGPPEQQLQYTTSVRTPHSAGSTALPPGAFPVSYAPSAHPAARLSYVQQVSHSGAGGHHPPQASLTRLSASSSATVAAGPGAVPQSSINGVAFASIGGLAHSSMRSAAAGKEPGGSAAQAMPRSMSAVPSPGAVAHHSAAANYATVRALRAAQSALPLPFQSPQQQQPSPSLDGKPSLPRAVHYHTSPTKASALVAAAPTPSGGGVAMGYEQAMAVLEDVASAAAGAAAALPPRRRSTSPRAAAGSGALYVPVTAAVPGVVAALQQQAAGDGTSPRPPATPQQHKQQAHQHAGVEETPAADAMAVPTPAPMVQVLSGAEVALPTPLSLPSAAQ